MFWGFSHASSLFLALWPEITPSGAWGLYAVLEIKPALVVCKANNSLLCYLFGPQLHKFLPIRASLQTWKLISHYAIPPGHDNWILLFPIHNSIQEEMEFQKRYSKPSKRGGKRQTQVELADSPCWASLLSLLRMPVSHWFLRSLHELSPWSQHYQTQVITPYVIQILSWENSQSWSTTLASAGPEFHC